MKKLPIIALLFSAPAVVWSDGSPWLPADGRTTIGVNVTSGSTEEFFIGEESVNLGGDLDGTFVWFTASYGYDDIWAFDVRTGYAQTSLETNPSELDREDIADTSFGVSYQFINEFEAVISSSMNSRQTTACPLFQYVVGTQLVGITKHR